MKKWMLELIIMVVSITLISIAVKIFGLENTTICILATIISKVMATDIWKEQK